MLLNAFQTEYTIVYSIFLNNGEERFTFVIFFDYLLLEITYNSSLKSFSFLFLNGGFFNLVLFIHLLWTMSVLVSKAL